MKFKVLFLFLFTYVTSISCFAQKAYETISYSGKIDHYSFELQFTDGYIQGSTIEISNIKTGKKSIATIETKDAVRSKNIIFNQYPSNGSKLKDYILLKNTNSTTLTFPSKISGYYFVKNKKYNILLKKKTI